MNLYSFLRGFSQCRRRIHSSTQMMCYIDFSKSRFFDFFLDWSPGSKNVPQACRDLPGRFATLPDPENRPKTSKNAILFENYFFNCWRQFLFLSAFKHYGFRFRFRFTGFLGLAETTIYPFDFFFVGWVRDRRQDRGANRKQIGKIWH